MTSLVDAREAEVPILPHLTILSTVHNHRLISGSAELFAVGVIDSKTDGFATEPVACLR
jgi:hypothetical protein